MFAKRRSMSVKLLYLRALFCRDGLDEKKRKYFFHLYKGYLGECDFDNEWLTRLPDGWIILNDLELEHNNSPFQIDSLLIASKTIYLLDAKTFENEYYYDPSDERIYYVGYNHDGNDALNQLKRSERLLKSLLHTMGYDDFIVTKKLIFGNPDFTLFGLPHGLPIVLPSQLNGFIEGLRNQKIENGSRQNNLANALIEKTLSTNPWRFLERVNFNYKDLKKGFFCEKCFSLMVKSSWYKLRCTKCGCVEKIDDAVMRNVDDYRLLLPENVITTKDIYEWCGGKVAGVSMKTIRRILGNNMNQRGGRKNTIFV